MSADGREARHGDEIDPETSEAPARAKVIDLKRHFKRSVGRVCAYEYLTEANSDVAKANSKCREIGLDLSPIDEILSDEASVNEFFSVLREYLIMVEIALNANDDIDSTAIFHPEKCLREASRKFAQSVTSVQERSQKKVQIRNLRGWVEERM
ncbi:MAG TPA: hypothetical protein P5229_05040 [Candidatus Gracilibacteria bacterium]|nr:hypothetical protein [Candidatus Gracilibacteria bacterium]